MVVICALAEAAASWTVFLPLRICVSMLRRMFAFSTFVQFLAVGTNHVERAACASAEPGVPLTRLRSDVVFGRLPTFARPAIAELDVNSFSQSTASALFELAAGIAR